MKNTNNSSGLGLGGVLTVVFVVLKLIGSIDWSWWWVLSPVWITLGIALIVAAIYVAVEIYDYKKYNSKKGKK